MEIPFVSSWKLLAFRGLEALLFGAIAFLWPSIALASLVLIFGAYALADGFLAIAAAMRAPERLWTLLIEGLAGVGIGLAAFLWMGATETVLVRIIALWATLTGMLEVALAMRLRQAIPGEFLLAVAGITSLVLGVLMLLWPGASAFVIVVLLGSYGLLFGGSMLALALQLRRLTSEANTFHHDLHSRAGPA